MAEGFLRTYAGDRFSVQSAGTKATELHPLAVRAMREVGIDISRQKSKSVDEVGEGWDVVVTVCDANCPIPPRSAMKLRWSFPDPALAGGRESVVALALGAPHDAEPDTPSIDAVGAIVRRLGRGLPGSTVYLAGEFKTLDKDAITAAIEKAGARVVGGPFPGTDYYVHGDWCAVQTIAQLERQGTRRLKRGELEGI